LKISLFEESVFQLVPPNLIHRWWLWDSSCWIRTRVGHDNCSLKLHFWNNAASSNSCKRSAGSAGFWASSDPIWRSTSTRTRRTLELVRKGDYCTAILKSLSFFFEATILTSEGQKGQNVNTYMFPFWSISIGTVDYDIPIDCFRRSRFNFRIHLEIVQCTLCTQSTYMYIYEYMYHTSCVGLRLNLCS
jgi:hypothetical protein